MRKAWVVLPLAVAVVVGGGVTGAVVLRSEPAPTPPAVVPPSPDPTRTALLAPAPTSAAVPTATGLSRALALALRDPRLGRRLALSVVDVATDTVLLERDGARLVTPASTVKIATAVAALSVLDARQRFSTRVVAGARPGDVVLVGGGDPTLAGTAVPPPTGAHAAPAEGGSLVELAASTRAARKGARVARVLVDDTLFTGPRTGPGWKPGYVNAGSVAPVSALEVDGGRTSPEPGAPRARDAALQAGRQLARLLGARAVARGRAAADATELARVESPAVAALVERMLSRSDNDLAEALGRHVALASRRPASFAGEVAAVAAAVQPLLEQAGVRRGLALRDTSGLSPLNRLTPAALTRLLAAVAEDDRFAPVLSGLPVAGFDGTLSDRYRRGPARVAAGQVRAKTGTLNGVSALAGLVRTRSGRLLAFDLTADGVPFGATAGAQVALDRVAAVLASCGCR